MNKVILTGRLTRDAELRYIPNTGAPVMEYSLAVERNFQKDKENKIVDFINCVQFGKNVENLIQYVTRGKLILVEGELNINRYEKNGEKRNYTQVHVSRLEFLSSGNKDNQSNPTFEPSSELNPNEFQAIDDDDIPF